MKPVPTDALLAATLRAIGDGVISCDGVGRVVLMNDVAQQLTGWAEQDAIGCTLPQVFVIVNETTRLPVEDPVGKVLRLGRTVGLANHTLLIRRDGSEVAIDDSAAPVYGDGGELVGVVLVFRSVTERRRAEMNLELLSRSGAILADARDTESIFQGIGSAAAVHFADFCVFDLLGVDGSLTRAVGPHRDAGRQAIATALQRFPLAAGNQAHPANIARATRRSVLMNNSTDEMVRAMAGSAEHLAYLREEVHPRSLLFIPLLAAGNCLGTVGFFRNTLAAPFTEADLATAEDLTQRVAFALHYSRIREELRLERAQLEAVVNNVPIGIIVANQSGKLVRVNEETDRIFRHSARLSQTVADYGEYVGWHPDGRQVLGEEYPMAQAMSQNRPIRDQRYLYQRGDGTKGWISVSGAPVRDEGGAVIGGVVAVADIDDLVQAQQRAQTSDHRQQLLMDRASVGITVGDLTGGLSYANETMLRWIGYSKEELSRGEVRWDDLTPSHFSEKDANAVQQLRESGYASAYEKAYIAKDGHVVPMLVGATMVPSADDTSGKQDLAAFYTNLSLQKRAEAALLQTEKLTAVGRLASSISHEINNPLEAVTNLLYIVRNDPTLSSGGKDYLDAADRELARVSQVTSQTLRFHRQSTAATLVEPKTLLDEVLGIYSSRLQNAGIAVSREYRDDVAVTCYEGDIRQVLNNLVNNALASMQGGGRLRLRTRFITWWKTGQKGVRITVADTGTGMLADVRTRIFDAFYTTKGIHGTGLGLWISQRIVHKHRGHIRAKSSTALQHHGTVFTLWLPLELAESAREAWYAESSQE